jgi:hypothetical protein
MERGRAVMEVHSGRVEKRLVIAVPIWLTSSKNPGPFEKAVTENVSSVGARIIQAGTGIPVKQWYCCARRAVWRRGELFTLNRCA